MEYSTDRTEKLLALLLLKDIEEQKEKIRTLNLAGFSNVEIADLLQTSSPIVAQSLYEVRKHARHPASRRTRGKRKK